LSALNGRRFVQLANLALAVTANLDEAPGPLDRLLLRRDFDQREATDDFFDSVKGPSVTAILPLARRTRAPSALGRHPSVESKTPEADISPISLPMSSIVCGLGGPFSSALNTHKNLISFLLVVSVSTYTSNDEALNRQSRRRSFSVSCLTSPADSELGSQSGSGRARLTMELL
jgi:hypothetical protein